MLPESFLVKAADISERDTNITIIIFFLLDSEHINIELTVLNPILALYFYLKQMQLNQSYFLLHYYIKTPKKSEILNTNKMYSLTVLFIV